MNLIRLTTCNSSVDAHLLKSKLESVGIPCFLTNENFTTLMPHLNHMLGAGVQVMINKTDAEKALAVLEETHSKNGSTLVCPNCGSEKIKTGLGKRKGIKIINVIVSLFSGIPFGNMNSKYICSDCKTEW